ncbi:MAG: hypothetical protein HC799_13820 [Limnothrix sp. RL_2_0]|nr:hypothetical protein [Limnothrix sp. RL_2_0]
MKWFLGTGWALGFAVLSLVGDSNKPVQAQFFRETYEYLRTCDQVRDYRSRVSGFSRELATLEYQYCQDDRPYYNTRRSPVKPTFVSVPAVSASEDCVDATILARLAIAHEPYDQMTSEIAGFQQVLCSLPTLDRGRSTNLEWQNGRKAKFGNAWYFPNGNNAKFGDNWYYPNGEKAKFGNAWYFPNGRSAKFGNNWYFPDGDRTNLASLLSWSCGILSYFDCQERLDDLQTSQGFWYDLTVVELSSRAYDRIYDYNRARTYSDGNPDVDIDIDIIIK